MNPQVQDSDAKGSYFGLAARWDRVRRTPGARVAEARASRPHDRSCRSQPASGLRKGREDPSPILIARGPKRRRSAGLLRALLRLLPRRGPARSGLLCLRTAAGRRLLPAGLLLPSVRRGGDALRSPGCDDLRTTPSRRTSALEELTEVLRTQVLQVVPRPDLDHLTDSARSLVACGSELHDGSKSDGSRGGDATRCRRTS
jgi:hypothetical protein